MPKHAKAITSKTTPTGRIIACAIFSYLFSLAWVLPSYFSSIGIVKCLAISLGPSVAVFALLSFIFAILDDRRIALPRPSERSLASRYFLIPLALLLILDLIVLLAVYPGLCSTDTEDIFKMILGMPFESNHFRYATLNNHHPAFYTFLNWLVMTGALALGASQATSVALIAGFHAVCVALSCAYTSAVLYQLSRSKKIYVFTIGFFAINPLLMLYSVTIWKDVLFGAFFLVYLVTLLKLFSLPNERPQIKNLILLGITALLCSLLRNNGVMAIVLSLLVTVVACKPLRKALGALLLCLLIFYFAITGPIFSLFGVQSGHFSESVGIPLQQIARTISDDGAISNENKELFASILPIDQWKESYDPSSPNGIKFSADFNDEFLEENKGAFFKAWLQTGLSNPGIYFAAWMYETYPFWSTNSTTWYFTSPGYTLGDTTVSGTSLIPFASYDGLVLAANAFILVLGPMFNDGWLAWIMLAVVLYNALRKERSALFVLLPLVLYWGTYLAAAPASDFRYVFPLYLCIPLFCFLCKYELTHTDLANNDKNVEPR